jgi:lipoprotein-anchoring transpeptidase ErfK/SrfK
MKQPPVYRHYNDQPLAKSKKRHLFRGLAVLLAIVVIAGASAYAADPHLRSDLTGTKTHVVQETKPAAKVASKPTTTTKPAPTPTTTPATNMCAGNTLSQLVVVSISQRHLWACDDTTVLYDSPVVTGMENLAADLTPTGTYHIYAKETDVYLKGSDSTGSWDDFVNYWMPFLSNQYGTYGFHDATWRPTNAFGNISPYSSNASHGCVELPLATAKWLYGWAQVGTTLTIES